MRIRGKNRLYNRVKTVKQIRKNLKKGYSGNLVKLITEITAHVSRSRPTCYHYSLYSFAAFFSKTIYLFAQNAEQQQPDHAAVGHVLRPVPPTQHPSVRQPILVRLQAGVAVPTVAAQDSQARVVHALSRARQHGRTAAGRHAQTSHAMR